MSRGTRLSHFFQRELKWDLLERGTFVHINTRFSSRLHGCKKRRGLLQTSGNFKNGTSKRRVLDIF